MSSFDKFKKRLEKDTASKEKQVAKRYARLYKDINKLISKQFDKYEVDGKLTYENMAKYKRLEKLLKKIDKKINNADTGLRNEIHGHLREQYEESYYQSAFVLETSAEAKLAYTKVKDEVIDEAINTKFTGLTLNERLSKRRGQLITNMRENITRGLVQGQTYGDMANIIKDQLEGDRAKAQRIVRTEAHRIRETASLESVKHAEDKGVVMKKTWNTVHDERVREAHTELDGITKDTDAKFAVDGYETERPNGFGVAYLDINCRCYLTYEIVRVDRPKDNNLADLDYAEWQKERLNG